MSLVMFALWILAGLLAGLLAGIVTKRGGYGLRWDIIFGLVGSIVGSATYRALAFSPGAGVIAMVIVAFIGAAGVIVVQRKIWPAIA